jgi:hypothetical protein
MSTALREAAQQALEAMENSRVFVTTREKIKHPEGTEWYDERITALRDALAQEEQAEPVLVVEKEPDYMSRGHFYEGSKPFIDPTLVWKLPIGTKLYTAPPRREWQGLTDEEIDRVVVLLGFAQLSPPEVARAIEQALKEKNA